MRALSAHLRPARGRRGAAQGWPCGGPLALVRFGVSRPGFGQDVQRLAATASSAPAPVIPLPIQ